jgi:hypothetical protein
VAAIFFYFPFVFVMLFVTFNITIAIIMDGSGFRVQGSGFRV